MADRAQLFEVPGTLERYLVYTKLNKGGMADVYLGQPLGDSAWIALKTLRASLASDARFIEMFKAEGRLGQRLTHDHIAPTLDVGSSIQSGGEVHYLAMEYVHGRDMGAVARRLRRASATMSPPQVLFIACGVLKALAYAHKLQDEGGKPLNIVNRDISPPNVMVDFHGRVRLIDFGIAQANLAYRSQIGAIKGKIRYMSPEQVSGHAVDARSDLFSLAVVCYQLLTGIEPFAADAEFEQMERVRSARVEAPSKANPQIERMLEAALMRALAKRREDRFVDAEEMLAAFEAATRQYEPFTEADMAAFMTTMFARDMVKLKDAVREAKSYLMQRYARSGETSAEVSQTLDTMETDLLLVGDTALLDDTGDLSGDRSTPVPPPARDSGARGLFDTKPVRVIRKDIELKPVVAPGPLASDEFPVVEATLPRRREPGDEPPSAPTGDEPPSAPTGDEAPPPQERSSSDGLDTPPQEPLEMAADANLAAAATASLMPRIVLSLLVVVIIVLAAVLVYRVIT